MAPRGLAKCDCARVVPDVASFVAVADDMLLPYGAWSEWLCGDLRAAVIDRHWTYVATPMGWSGPIELAIAFLAVPCSACLVAALLSASTGIADDMPHALGDSGEAVMCGAAGLRARDRALTS